MASTPVREQRRIEALIRGVDRGKLLVHVRRDDGTDLDFGLEPSAGDFLRSTESWQWAEEHYGDGPELTFFSDSFSWLRVRDADPEDMQVVFVRRNESIVQDAGGGFVRLADGSLVPYTRCPLADHEDPNFRETPCGVETGDWFTRTVQDVLAVVTVADLEPFLGDRPLPRDAAFRSGGQASVPL